MPYTDRIPYTGKDAVVIVLPPKYLPCECKGGKSTEHQYNRDGFLCAVYVCCECGREKRVKK